MQRTNDLVEYRAALLLKVAQDHLLKTWISPFQYDGTKVDGHFIIGINIPSGLITFHVPTEYWDLAVQLPLRVLEKAIRAEDLSHADRMKRLLQWISYQRKSSPNGIGTFTDYVASISTVRNNTLDQLKPPSIFPQK